MGLRCSAITSKTTYSGPVAVGGLGGSGTRVMAEILREIGFYIGSDLNAPCDNLWFTLLFKRPTWFIRNSKEKKAEIFKALRIFEKAMTSGLMSRPEEYLVIMRAAVDWSIPRTNSGRSGILGRASWALTRMVSMILSKKPDPSRHRGWGWKEPNTHIYIKYINEYFDNLKYIHVVRHGLDMAYSHNQQQLYNWGEMFGISPPYSSKILPQLALKYWTEANKRAIKLCKEILHERFLILNFDELCSHPERVISNLIDFLGLDINPEIVNKLVSLPNTPKSAGRYRQHDLKVFTRDEIESVRKFGFKIDLE